MPPMPAELDLRPIAGAEGALTSALIDIELTLDGNAPPVDREARSGDDMGPVTGDRRGGATFVVVTYDD